MTRFTFGRNCPHCGDTEKRRIPRRLWMKLIPQTKYFRCEWCGYQFIPISERRSGLKERRRSHSINIMNDRRSGIADRRRISHLFEASTDDDYKRVKKYEKAYQELKSMDIPIVIDKFFAYATKNNIEIYNEIALQFELANYFQKSLGKEYKIQPKRNISFFGMTRGNFIKKEIDIVIFSDAAVLKDIFIVELKAILNQKRAKPIDVFNWIKDLKFLEQLKSNGVGNCYSLFLTDNDKLVSENTSLRSNVISPLLPDFRNRRIQGEYFTHCTPNPNSKSVTLGSEYTFKWKDFVCGQKYFLVEV